MDSGVGGTNSFFESAWSNRKLTNSTAFRGVMYEEMSAGTVPQLTAAVESRANSQNACFAANRLKRDSFDREYVQRLKDGDRDTERHFVSYFGELLLIKLRSRLRNHQMIEDLRQEAFVRVLTALKSSNRLNSPESLGAFVNSV